MTSIDPPLIIRDGDVFDFWEAQGRTNVEDLETQCDRLDALMHVFAKGGIYFVHEYLYDFLAGG